MGKPDIVIVCQCGRIDNIRAKANLPSPAVANMFRNRGWKVDASGKAALCKDCQRKMKKSNGSAVSANAMKSHVAAVRLLDDHFHVDAGRYDEGWSDKAIAEKVSLAETAITDLRENAYGALSVSPEVAKIEADILAAQKHFQGELDQARELLTTVSNEFGQQIAALRLRLEEATGGKKRQAA